MENTGWHTPTIGLIDVEKLAEAGKELDLPKPRCVVALMRVAAPLGLKDSERTLLNTLLSYSPRQDWEKGENPIVWPSNATLLEETGKSQSALNRGLKRLAEAGLISFQYSPNGQRRGCRDKNGRIVEAYGIDLAPIAARNAEFEALHREIKEETRLRKRYAKQITIVRRHIRAMIEAASSRGLAGPWKHLLDLFNRLLEKLPLKKQKSGAVAKVLELFQNLHAQVTEAFCAAYPADVHAGPTGPAENSGSAVVENAQKTGAKVPENGAHLLTTKQLMYVQSNRREEISRSEPPRQPKPTGNTDSQEKKENGEKTLAETLELPTVMQACPRFAGYARTFKTYLRNWPDFCNVAGKLRGYAGISQHAWNDALRHLGELRTALALALILDKFDAGEVTSPGGYLRGIVEKAKKNELNLEKSIYGRLGQQIERAKTRKSTKP